MPRRLTSKRPAKRVLVVGWDAADWRVIDPMLDAGRMPALEQIVEGGVRGNLATIRPILSPMLWTSIATGMRAYQHGIHGFTEPRQDGRGVTPVTSLSRKVKAVWNILQQNGLRSNVVGWWPTHPAEPIDGVMVSNHYAQATAPLGEPWPMLPGTVHPERLAETLAELRVHPNELEAEHLLPFVPRAAEVDQTRDPRLLAVARTLAECSSVHSAATWIMENEPWDFMAVYLDAIDHFSHGFMRYHPPRGAHVAENDFDLYHQVVETAYWYHGVMLGRLIELAGEDTTVILVSDHGFHSDHLRPEAVPHEPAGPAEEHRHLGIFAMQGPGIKRDATIYGASLLDVTPTILTLFGLPVGEDMEGRPLLDAFEEPREIETIPSWELVEGKTGQHPAGRQLDADSSDEALRQLVALGYVEDPSDDHQEAMDQAQRELDYNLALSYMDADRHAEAMPILEALFGEHPEEHRYGFRLAWSYQALGRVDEMRAVVEWLIEARREAAEQARARLREIQSSAREGTVFDVAQKREIGRLEGVARLNTFPLDYLMGHVCLVEGLPDEALVHLARAERADPGRPGLHTRIGEAYLELERWSDAARSFSRALEIDPESPHAHLGLARSELPRELYQQAAHHAQRAIGLLFHYPAAHYFAGVAYHHLGRLEEAREALERAVSLNPNFREAHDRLARLCDEDLGLGDKASASRETILEIERLAEERRRLAGGFRAIRSQIDQVLETRSQSSPSDLPDVMRSPGEAGLVTVVSGLPRSGTSMTMQMLAAGGLPLLTDGVRTADDDNPEGYLELEAVKRIAKDDTWLAGAVGHAVKIISPLLPKLPPAYRYHIIFMDRDLREVLASQRAMLARMGQAGAELSEDELRAQFERNNDQVKRWLRAQPNVELLEVEHRKAIADPEACAAAVNAFLGGRLDEDAMAEAVDPSLHRQRVASS